MVQESRENKHLETVQGAHYVHREAKLVLRFQSEYAHPSNGTAAIASGQSNDKHMW